MQKTINKKKKKHCKNSQKADPMDRFPLKSHHIIYIYIFIVKLSPLAF